MGYMIETPDTGDENAPAFGTSRNDVMLLSIFIEGGMGAVAVFLGWLIEIPFHTTIHLSPPDWFSIGIGTGFGIAAAILALIIQRLPLGFAKSLREKVDQIATEMLGQCNLADLIGISLLAGVGEELMFRGLIQQGLTQYLGNVPLVIAIVALLFGLLHSLSVTYVIAAAIASVGLSVLYVYTNDLISVMICHAVYDLVLLIIAKNSSTEKDEG